MLTRCAWSSGDPVFVGFTFDTVIVYYNVGATTPFPPPGDSTWRCAAYCDPCIPHTAVPGEIGKQVQLWLRGARPMPRLLVVRSGTRGAQLAFQQLLLEDEHDRCVCDEGEARCRTLLPSVPGAFTHVGPQTTHGSQGGRRTAGMVGSRRLRQLRLRFVLEQGRQGRSPQCWCRVGAPRGL